MKRYNANIYKVYISEVQDKLKNLKSKLDYENFTREQLIIKFLPLVENIAKKYSTSYQASGVMNILDLIQEGNLGLMKAIDRINWDIYNKSKNKESTLISFLAKRIRGAIRRSINLNRSIIKIPEHRLQKITNDFNKDKEMVSTFFKSLFLSTDEVDMDYLQDASSKEDISEKKRTELLNVYLTGLLRKHLNSEEYQVLRLSYGLDCRKHSGPEIATLLGLKNPSDYVKVSLIKKVAVNKLIENVDPSQVLHYT